MIYDFTVVNVVATCTLHVNSRVLAGRWRAKFTNKCMELVTIDYFMNILIEHYKNEKGRNLDDALQLIPCRLVFCILHISYALIKSSFMSGSSAGDLLSLVTLACLVWP